MKTDTELQRDVMDALEREPSIEAAEIRVSARDGAVNLSGYVDSYIKRWVATRVATGVLGVKAVEEELEVMAPDSPERSVEDIASAAVSALDWKAAVPPETWLIDGFMVGPTIKPHDVEHNIVSSFQRNGLLDSKRITVETCGAWVILSGSVRSWSEKAEAQWAAFAAQGVLEVENNIKIRP